MWSGAGLVTLVVLSLAALGVSANSLQAYDLPVSEKVANLRLRTVLSDHHDVILVSQDRGAQWSTVFSGRVDRVQLPIMRQEFALLKKPTVLPKDREDVFLDFADYAVHPDCWWFAFSSLGRTYIVTRDGSFPAPDLGRISKIYLGESGNEGGQSFHIVAVAGSVGQGTYLYFDYHPPLKLSDHFVDHSLGAVMNEGILNFTNVTLAHRFGVRPVMLQAPGLAAYEAQNRVTAQVEELRRAVDNPDYFRNERLYREMLDSHLITHYYLKDRSRTENARILNVVREIWRERLCAGNLALYQLSKDPRYRRNFDFLVDDLSQGWLAGVIQYWPTLRLARAILSGRPESQASLCETDLRGFKPKSEITQETLRSQLEYLALALRISW